MHWEKKYIAGVGVSMAPVVPVADVVAAGRYAPADAAKTRQVGVAVGHRDDPGPDYAVRASAQALTQAGKAAAAVSSLVYHYAIHPGVDVANIAAYVADQLSIPAGSLTVHQTTGGCHAGLTGAELACALLDAFLDYETVLVPGADVAPSPVMDRWEAGAEIPHADGGAAALIARIGRYLLISTATRSDVSVEAMHRGDEPWGPGRVTDDHPIHMVSRIRHFRGGIARDDLIDRVRTVVIDSVLAALWDAGAHLTEIDHVILPFVGAHIRERTYMKWLDLATEQVRVGADCAQEVGHLTTSDPFVALDRLIRSGELRPGQRALLIADGSGFVCSSLVVQALD